MHHLGLVSTTLAKLQFAIVLSIHVDATKCAAKHVLADVFLLGLLHLAHLFEHLVGLFQRLLEQIHGCKIVSAKRKVNSRANLFQFNSWQLYTGFFEQNSVTPHVDDTFHLDKVYYMFQAI